MIKEVEFIVSGEVHGVGYRQYVTKIGRKLKLAGFAENLKDGTVRIGCKGDEEAISEFKKQIKVNKPGAAPLIEVEDMQETPLATGTIMQTIFEEKYGEPGAEMSQGFSTGMNYINLFRAESQVNFNRVDASFNQMDANFNRVDANLGKLDNTINSFKNESMANFGKLDTTINAFKNETATNFGKLDLTVNELKNETVTRFDRLDEKYDKISQAMFAVVSEIKESNKAFESRMEKTEKSIESLLKILVQKKI